MPLSHTPSARPDAHRAARAAAPAAPKPRRRRPPLARGLLLAALVALAGCAGLAPPPPAAPGPAPAAGLTLTIAHINDHHAQLEGFPGTELRLAGVPTQVELGGFARQTAFFRTLDGTPGLLKLHAGDALTGSLYHTFFKGRADAQLMNTVCFDAFIPGNHEFDEGDATLARFLDELDNGPCRTPVLSANVVPAAGTPLAPAGRPPRLQPWVIRQVDGVAVGLVGITVKGKTQASSRPLPSTVFRDEAEAAQAAIDALRARGVRHVVLMTHIGYEADRALATQLRGVDVIIGGDSHTLLGDFGRLGVPSSGPYPTVVRNRDGDPVCIGQSWEYAKAAGLMRVRFDPDGRVRGCDGQAALLIGSDFRRQDAAGRWQPLPGDQARTLRAALAAEPAVRVLEPDPVAAGVLAGFTGQVAAQKARVIGTATEALCLVRVPGESTNPSAGVAGCEDAHRRARGSDIAQVVAEAFLAADPRADVALQNAGGVRVPVPAGPLTMNTAFSVLPFANVLVEVELSGAELRTVLEDGVANHVDLGQSNGSHPYAAGLRWELDLRAARGQRLGRLEVRDKATGRWGPLEPDRRYVLITHDFLAAGKDGYATLGAIAASGRAVNTYLLYTQTFVDRLLAQHAVARPPRDAVSHQRVVTADGRELP